MLSQPTGGERLRGKQAARDQQQPRDERAEVLRRGELQEYDAEQRADPSADAEAADSVGLDPELLAEAGHSAGIAERQGDGIGDVGRQRWQADEHQSREGNQ